MWQGLFGKNFVRKRLLRTLASGPMQDFLSEPFPTRGSGCSSTELVALDLETTGLDAGTDQILSVGLVPVRNGSILLDRAWYRVVRIAREVPADTAIIHGITDDASAQGAPLAEVLPEVLARLSGKVLLAHHAAVELGFINAACMRLYGVPFLIPVIDTQLMAKQLMQRRDIPYKARDLRLSNLRDRYNLPRYAAHHALSDALATAELFLAMATENYQRKNCRLKEFCLR